MVFSASSPVGDVAVGPLPDDTNAVAASDYSETASAEQAGAELPKAFDRFQSEQEFRDWLIGLADELYGNLFGTDAGSRWVYPSYFDDFDGLVVPVELASFAVDRGVETNGLGADYSETNVQVEGVDEADLMETDGEYVYLITGKDLLIVKAGTGDELQVASRIELDSEPTGMYLDGDRLVLLSKATRSRDIFSLGWAIDDYWYPQSKAPTTVTVLDVADRTAPSLVQKLELDGRLQDSRVVDGQLRLVINNEFQLPRPKTRLVESETIEYADHGEIVTFQLRTADTMFAADLDSDYLIDYDFSPSAKGRYEYESREEYIERVIDDLVDDLPGARQVTVGGETIREVPFVEAEEIYRPELARPDTFTTIATIDIHDDTPGIASKASVIHEGGAATIHATRDGVYLFTSGGRHSSHSTEIRKFEIDDETGDIELVAKGGLDGRLLNQFAIDEHDGYLRVVVENGSDHQLLVFAEDGESLELVGQVDGLGPREELHSVRFLGDRAFVVTFRKVDPLFAIDLSDPTNPVVAGELKIPGFSDYLQPIDENHLLGIGRGAEQTGRLFEEMQVSIFDVSDLNDPQLAHRYSIGGGRTTASIATGDRWAEGDGDHHAVGYFPSAQILALPIFNAGTTAWRNQSQIDNTPLFELGDGGLQVLSVDPATGLQPLALIEHDAPIGRSLRIAETLYAISPGTITVHDLNDPTTELGRLEIGADEDTVYTELLDLRDSIVVPPIGDTTLEQATTSAFTEPSLDVPLAIDGAVIADADLSILAIRDIARLMAESSSRDRAFSRLADSDDAAIPLSLDLTSDVAVDWAGVSATR